MTIARYRKSKLSYQQILRAARVLSAAEQRRLRIALAQPEGVYLERPGGDATSRRRARRLAATVRNELNKTLTDTLEETMSRLRGRAWS